MQKNANSNEILNPKARETTTRRTPGVDSSYHIHPKRECKKEIIWGTSVYGIHKGRTLFLVVSTTRKAINFFDVKVDAQKAPLRFRGKFDNRFVSYIQFTLSTIGVMRS